jgi:membrane protein implicated in regulation of membrane protease activity
MRPWQNALAIIAGFFVAGALLPWSLRLACALAAIGIVLLLLVFRLRAHATLRQKERVGDIEEKIARIRGSREQRLGRRSPTSKGDTAGR